MTYCCIAKPKLDAQDIYSRVEMLRNDLICCNIFIIYFSLSRIQTCFEAFPSSLLLNYMYSMVG